MTHILHTYILSVLKIPLFQMKYIIVIMYGSKAMNAGNDLL